MGSKSSPRRQLYFDAINDDDDEQKYDSPDEGTEIGSEDFMDWTCLKDLNIIHASIAAEMIPSVDMEFESEEKAFEYYLAYAKKVGFSIRKSKSYSNKNGKLISRAFCCSAEGKRTKDKRYSYVKAPRAETRFGCLAKMKVSSRQNGKLRVVEFVADHNHNLSSPNKTHMHRSHRNISCAQAANIEMVSSVGIAPKAAHDLMVKQAGGREHVGFIPDDYKNYLRSKKTRAMKAGDTRGVMEYLQKMQFDDPNFFYSIQLDEDAMIRDIFWCDGKMKADYAKFGDVVCFDTTYRKNAEGRPIALFVGVNHHKQTCIFGGALLYDETALTFQWLFDTFSRAMIGKKPKTILTDQDAAMAKALSTIWPETHHRLCIWHINQNAAIHLSSVFSEFKNFSYDFSKCIYDFEEEEDFVNAWNQMLDKYDLRHNEWLKRMFGIREKWALVYGRQTFCADMTTTQRSESMNKALKGYVNYKHNFLDFFNNFQRLLENRRYKESTADFKADISLPSLRHPCELLKHAVCIYTPEVFAWFESEWSKSIDTSCRDCGEVGSTHRYEITPYGKQYHHTVLYDSEKNTFDCSCKKFEFSGIFCSHILKVFSTRNIVKIPTQYILKRWTRRAKTGYIEVEDSLLGADPKMVLSKRYRELCGLYVQLATKASETEETYKMAKDALLEMIDKVDERLSREASTFESLGSVADSCDQLETNIGEESARKIKGIKDKPKVTSGKRWTSSLEKASKKRKACGKTRRSSKTAHLEPPQATYAEAAQNTCTDASTLYAHHQDHHHNQPAQHTFLSASTYSTQHQMNYHTQDSQNTFANAGTFSAEHGDHRHNQQAAQNIFSRDNTYSAQPQTHHYSQHTQQSAFSSNDINTSPIDLNIINPAGQQFFWFPQSSQAQQSFGGQGLMNCSSEQHMNMTTGKSPNFPHARGIGSSNMSGIGANSNAWMNEYFSWPRRKE